jgi:hypothetical protein
MCLPKTHHVEFRTATYITAPYRPFHDWDRAKTWLGLEPAMNNRHSETITIADDAEFG